MKQLVIFVCICKEWLARQRKRAQLQLLCRINQRIRLLENDIRVMKSEQQRLTHEMKTIEDGIARLAVLMSSFFFLNSFFNGLFLVETFLFWQRGLCHTGMFFLFFSLYLLFLSNPRA